MEVAMLGIQPSNDGNDRVKPVFMEVEAQLARCAGKQWPGTAQWTDGEMAAGAVHTFVVPTAKLPFEQCAPILCKAFRSRAASKILLYCSQPCFKFGYFLLKCYVLVSECSHSVRLGIPYAEFRRRRYSTNAWDQAA